MTSLWPPAPTDEAGWREELFQIGGRLNERVTVREVRLWGRPVLIDEAHDVWCSGCMRFVPVDVLGRADNGHLVGLPNRAGGALLPMDRTVGESGRPEPEGF